MTIKIGITGGIASGKTTITKFLRKRGFPVHDSDAIVKKIYLNPKNNFLKHLKKIGLSNSIKNKKINKKIIRDEVFNNKTKRKNLEGFIHNEVKKSRNLFLKKHKNKKNKIVILDIPLLFEAKLTKICDYIILLYLSKELKIKRALRRRNMKKEILLKILKNQLSDAYKKKRADFVINTAKRKEHSFKTIIKTIKKIRVDNAGNNS